MHRIRNAPIETMNMSIATVSVSWLCKQLGESSAHRDMTSPPLLFHYRNAVLSQECCICRQRRKSQGEAVSKIAEWLASLGMAEYTERFVENRIDLSVLQDLKDEDLKDLGVVLGDRRKMLRAIHELGGAPRATPELRSGTEPEPQDAAERRQLTVSSATSSVRQHFRHDLTSRICGRSSATIIEIAGR
jgi:hypothetical protein